MHTFSETGTGVPAFLAKLWRLVEDSDTNNLIYWSPDGKSFIIQYQAQFARELLPLNYKHNNMASFIRQLNMYGFHKITSIDTGGLKFDRDEMEFSHPYFQRGHPFLLEHIKRKIANTKTTEDKANLKPETANKVLNDVKVMRVRQDSLDSRFSAMKQENEALWREIAMLRQKHLKQQQIVNKLIQFLVTIVQPSRTGLNSMGGVKRRFQLMINDTPTTPKVRKTDNGPIIHELTEELLDEVNESDSDMLSDAPHVQSPSSNASKSPYSQIDLIDDMGNANEFNFEQASSSSTNYEKNKSSGSGIAKKNIYNKKMTDEEFENIVQIDNVNNEDETINYIVNSIDEMTEEKDDTSSSGYNEDRDVLNTPLVKKELAKATVNKTILRPNKTPPGMKEKPQPTNINKRYSKKNYSTGYGKNSKSLLNTKMRNENNDIDFLQNKNLNQMKIMEKNQPENPQTIINIDENDINDAFNDIIDKNTENLIDNDNSMSKSQMNSMYTSKENFISNEIPNELFDDDEIEESATSPMLGGFNLDGGNYNSAINVLNETTDKNQQKQDLAKDLAIKKYNSSKYPQNDEILRLSTPEDIDQHLDTVQGELDTLKELLRGDSCYTLDTNALLNNASGAGPNKNRLVISSPIYDSELFSKLFGDTDVLPGYGLPMMNPELMNLQEKKIDDNTTSGSELITYQPFNVDLSELLDDNDSPSQQEILNEYEKDTPSPPPTSDSNLNTPYFEKKNAPIFKTQ